VQVGPRAHAHPAVLLVLGRVLGRGRGPGGGIGAGERPPVPAGATGHGGNRRVGIGVETPILAQAHEGRHARLAPVERPLDRVVAGVEDAQGYRAVGGQAAYHLLHPRRRHVVRVLTRSDAPHVERRGPASAGQTQLVDPLVGPARHNRFPGRVARRVVIVTARGAGCGVAARPDADVNGVERLPVGKRVARQEVVHRAARHAAMREGRIRAAPPAAMGRGQTQVRGREGRPCRQQGIHELDEGIGAVAEARVRVGAEGAQDVESGCCVHTASLAQSLSAVELKRKLRAARPPAWPPWVNATSPLKWPTWGAREWGLAGDRRVQAGQRIGSLRGARHSRLLWEGPPWEVRRAWQRRLTGDSGTRRLAGDRRLRIGRWIGQG